MRICFQATPIMLQSPMYGAWCFDHLDQVLAFRQGACGIDRRESVSPVFYRTASGYLPYDASTLVLLRKQITADMLNEGNEYLNKNGAQLIFTSTHHE